MKRYLTYISLIAILGFGVQACNESVRYSDNYEGNGQNGNGENGNGENEPEPPAENDKCLDANTLQHQNADGSKIEVTCPDGCDDTTNRCKNDKVTPVASCSANTDAFCADENTAFICSDYWDYMGTGPTLLKQHCGANRKCHHGICVVDDANACGADYCKDYKTFVSCSNGKAKESACPANKLCIDRKCQDLSHVTKTAVPTLCAKDSDCKSDETCYDSLCYKKSNFDMKIGDDCDAASFQEYCKDGNEIKCEYRDTYRVVDEECGESCDCEYFFAKYNISSCTQDSDCKDGEKCYANHCYPGEQFDLNPGDDCTDYDFNLYCKDGHQYYCADAGMEKKIAAIPCATGCSTYLNAKYSNLTDNTGKVTGRAPNAIYFDAYCLGTAQEQAACTQPGLVYSQCNDYVDPDYPEFSFYYSVATTCIPGTDGQLIYKPGREETNCENQCNHATGLCK